MARSNGSNGLRLAALFERESVHAVHVEAREAEDVGYHFVLRAMFEMDSGDGETFYNVRGFIESMPFGVAGHADKWPADSSIAVARVLAEAFEFLRREGLIVQDPFHGGAGDMILTRKALAEKESREAGSHPLVDD